MRNKKTFAEIARKKLGDAEYERIHAEALRELEIEASLAEIRKELGLTQQEVAELAQMNQSDLSKLERREDHLVSSLRRVIEALGGSLEITAHVKGKTFRIA